MPLPCKAALRRRRLPLGKDRMGTAIAILVGSGLAEADSSWGVKLTDEGQRLKRSASKGSQGMRLIPGAISELLAARPLRRAPLDLPSAVFDPAREDYFDAARHRSDRTEKQRPGKRWWWPDRFGRYGR